MSFLSIPKYLFGKEIRKKKVFSHFCIQDRNIFRIFAAVNIKLSDNEYTGNDTTDS